MSADTIEWSHHASWPRDPSSVSKARRYVTERLTEHGETALLDTARLVVSELVTNAVRHARVDFELVLARVGDRVLVGCGTPLPVARRSGMSRWTRSTAEDWPWSRWSAATGV